MVDGHNINNKLIVTCTCMLSINFDDIVSLLITYMDKEELYAGSSV